MISHSDAIEIPEAVLRQVVLVGRVGPWRLYPGLAKIEVSSQWMKLFRIDEPPMTFPEYLQLIRPDNRERIAGETKRAFLMSEARHWESTFQRSGRLILVRAFAMTPGRVIGVDIDIT